MNVRKHGHEPFTVVVVHGGPGAAGDLASVAKEVCAYRGVLEPLEAATSIDGQVQELRSVIETHGNPPLTLVGHSWGAWLTFILAAQYPDLVKKVILVGSGPFEARYAESIMGRRFSRLNEQEQPEAEGLLKELSNSTTENSDALSRFGELVSKTDSYDPLPGYREHVEVQQNIYQHVWPEASELRRSGKLLQLGRKITAAVVAIHGDYDPHPAEGVREPLSRVLQDFKFILLENCGHRPWIERTAKDAFYEILRQQLD